MGDGNIENITSYEQGIIPHTYLAPGNYWINISGDIRGFAFNNTGDRLKISNISQWGGLRFVDTGGYFYGAENLMLDSANDVLYTTGITNMTNAFRGIKEDSRPLEEFTSFFIDVSNVIDMSYIFSESNFGIMCQVGIPQM